MEKSGNFPLEEPQCSTLLTLLHFLVHHLIGLGVFLSSQTLRSIFDRHHILEAPGFVV